MEIFYNNYVNSLSQTSDVNVYITLCLSVFGSFKKFNLKCRLINKLE